MENTMVLQSFRPTHYTDNLIAGMRGHLPERHDVLAEFGSAPAETEAYRCVPCFSRKEDYVAGIMAKARKLAPDVMEIQYSNDFFGDDNRFPRLLAELRAAGIRPMVNTHSIYPRPFPPTPLSAGQEDPLLEELLGNIPP
jgi:hypothetical protein